MNAFHKVLVIEDNPGDAHLVSGYLHDQFGKSCAVQQASTLADGLDVLSKAATDLVLLDLGLPDSEGLAGYVAVQSAAPLTPVVILTGQDDSDLALQALGTGAEDFLSKQSTNSETLLRAMRHAVLRRQLSKRNALLESSNAQLRSLSRTAALDLRSTLTGIIGMTRLVSRDAKQTVSTTAWRRLQLVEQSALQMNDLISRLLSLEMQLRPDLERDDLDLSAMAQSIADRLSVSEPWRQVRWRIKKGVVARGNPPLVLSLMHNLLDTAWRFVQTTAKAEIEFGCERGSNAEPIYFVRDNGPGFDIDTAQAVRLFAAFEHRSPSAADEDIRLGLFGAERIVECHGGNFWVKSTPGVGSQFRFTLGHGSFGEVKS